MTRDPKPPTRPSAALRRTELQHSAINSIRRIVRGLRLAAAQTVSDVHVTAAQLYVLAQLREAPSRSLSDLGERTMTDRSSVATVVERLVERGLVISTPAPEDRRRTVIEITSVGRAVLRRAPRPPGAVLAEGLAELGQRDLAALAAALEHLVEAMGLGAEPAPMLFDDDGASIAPGRGRPGRRRTR